MFLALLFVWGTLGTCFTSGSLREGEEDVHHGIWEREIKKSAERASAMIEFADLSSHLLDDVKAYYRIMLDSSSASEESEIIDLNPEPVETPRFYFQSGSPSNRYWIDPAPPFNPKPLHAAPTRDDAGLQIKIPARYMVMFQGRATKDHLTRTIAVMEEVTRISDRKIRATDFTPYEHVAKGFTATLNSAALIAVSRLHLIYTSHLLYVNLSCVLTHWLSSLKKIR